MTVRPLTRHSRIGVAAPASATLARARAEAGFEALKARGLTLEFARTPHPEALGYLAGTDRERADEMNALFRHDALDAIFCLRGGYGTLRILDRLDYDALGRNPKPIVGYSDATALQLAALSLAGSPSISGPMVAPDWPVLDEASERQFWQIAGGAAPVEVAGPGGEPLRGEKSGRASGTLVGGNLTLVCALLGTPFLPDLAGAILFVEDVGEKPYQIDRLLARLRLAGVLERLGGLVFGAFTQASPPPDRPSLTLDDVLGHYAQFVPGPVASGLVYGHFPRKSTLPIGTGARLEVENERARLTVTESISAHD